MSNLQSVYSKILDLLHEIESEDNFLNQIRIPMLSDKEMTSEMMYNIFLKKAA